MRTIYKYPMTFASKQVIEIHGFADILSVQMQNGVPCIWAMVNTTTEKIPVNIRIFGTGEVIPDEFRLRSIGTVQNGEYVWHIFIDDTVVVPGTFLRKERI